MASVNKELGNQIHEMLVRRGLETPLVRMSPENIEANGGKFETIRSCHNLMMRALGLDMQDDSLKDTPNRIAKMYCHEIFTGLNYDLFPDATVVENKFNYNEMVKVSGITVQSMCEHHFLPFVGTASIAYIPKDKVLGLSKFNRIVDFFARRPQIQERLTEQIAATLEHILDTEDVAVVIKADHFCVKLRGVKDTQSVTTTSKVLGKFRNVPELRAEFLALNGG